MSLSVVELAEIAARRQEPGRALAAVVELRRRLDELEEYHVENARSQGWAWSEIARHLRVTRQAVHKQHADRLRDWNRRGRRGRIVVSAAARRSVARARREAAALRHDPVGSEHLLLGLLEEETTADALATLGLSLKQTREAVVALRRRLDPGVPEASRSVRDATITKRGRDVLEQSLREALRLGDDEIGAKHVLLALLRDETCGARLVLAQLGVAPNAIEQKLT